MSGRSRFYFISISLPVIARPIAAGTVVVFLLALYDFPVHSLLQINTYLVEIYAASEYHDYRAATDQAFQQRAGLADVQPSPLGHLARRPTLDPMGRRNGSVSPGSW